MFNRDGCCGKYGVSCILCLIWVQPDSTDGKVLCSVFERRAEKMIESDWKEVAEQYKSNKRSTPCNTQIPPTKYWICPIVLLEPHL
jgi:hypothetical protein